MPPLRDQTTLKPTTMTQVSNTAVQRLSEGGILDLPYQLVEGIQMYPGVNSPPTIVMPSTRGNCGRTISSRRERNRTSACCNIPARGIAGPILRHCRWQKMTFERKRKLGLGLGRRSAGRVRSTKNKNRRAHTNGIFRISKLVKIAEGVSSAFSKNLL